MQQGQDVEDGNGKRKKETEISIVYMTYDISEFEGLFILLC